MSEPKRRPGRPTKLPPGERRTITCLLVNGEKATFDQARAALKMSQLEFTRAAIMHAAKIVVDGGKAPFDPLAGIVAIRGAVGAGPAIDEATTDGEVISLHKLFAGDVAAYVVRGDSMRDEAILNGDIIIIRETPSPTAGEKVVAWVEAFEGCVLKRYKGRGIKRWLESPDGWRRLALAFLEAQAWRESFAEAAREAPLPVPIIANRSKFALF